MIRVAIYARVSTDMQKEDELPIQGQIDECKRHAEAKGWQVVKVYEDAGYSGSNTERPAFQSLLADAKDKRFDKVVCWKGSRIARNVADRFAFHAILDRSGIDLVSLNEPEVDGAANILIRGMMASVDEYWSRTIAEDTLRGMKALVRQGYSAGGKPPKGYMPVREVIGLKKNGEPRFRVTWQPDPEWRERIHLAFQMLIEGYSSKDIIARTGIAKNPSSLCTLFRNPTYIGERCFNVHQRRRGHVVKVGYDDTSVIRVPEAHEAIISREMWDRAQEVLTKRRPLPGQWKSRRHNYILSGVLWCVEHDCPISAYGSSTHQYYTCNTRRKGSDCKLYLQEPLERAVIDAIKKQVYSPKMIRLSLQQIRDQAQRDVSRLQRDGDDLRAAIAKLDRELENFYKAIADGIAAGTLSGPIEDRQKKKSDLERQLREVKETAPTQLARIEVTDELIASIRKEALALLDADDPHTKRMFVSSLVDRIKIAGDSMEINFSFIESPASKPLRLKVAGVGSLYLQRISVPLPM